MSVALVWLAGCSVVPDDPEPIQAAADTAAVLPEGARVAEIVNAETTVETTVTGNLSGDVEMTARRDVNATVYRRVYKLAVVCSDSLRPQWSARTAGAATRPGHRT